VLSLARFGARLTASSHEGYIAYRNMGCGLAGCTLDWGHCFTFMTLISKPANQSTRTVMKTVMSLSELGRSFPISGDPVSRSASTIRAFPLPYLYGDHSVNLTCLKHPCTKSIADRGSHSVTLPRRAVVCFGHVGDMHAFRLMCFRFESFGYGCW